MLRMIWKVGTQRKTVFSNLKMLFLPDRNKKRYRRNKTNFMIKLMNHPFSFKKVEDLGQILDL